MAKKKQKPTFREQIPEIIKKLVEISENSPYNLNIDYFLGLRVTVYDCRDPQHDSVELCNINMIDWIKFSDKEFREHMKPTLDFIAKNAGAWVERANLHIGDKIYHSKRKCMVTFIDEGFLTLNKIGTDETFNLLGFSYGENYFERVK